jgi:large subunit ribosomal protein L29
MKPGVLRDLPLEELQQKHDELEQEYFGLRIKHALGQLENRLILRTVRRDIARAKTLLRENGVSDLNRRRRQTTVSTAKPKSGSSAKKKSTEKASTKSAKKSGEE